MKVKRRRLNADYFRTIVFGCEDSLVSTTGVIAGISVGTQDKATILLAGVVTVAVEALSMGAGQYLSEKAEHDYDRKKHSDSAVVGAIIMFISYSLAGFVPVLPIVFFPIEYSVLISICASLAGLFVLGVGKAKYARTKVVRSAIETLFIGGLAALIGAGVGLFLRV